MNFLDETSMLKLIYLIMQQNRFKKATGMDTSNLALQSSLAYLKAEVDKTN